MIQIVKNTIQSRIQKSWTSAKQTDDIIRLQERITKKHAWEKGRAPNLYIYRAKNKDRNNTINSCEMPQASDKSTKNPNFKSDSWLLNRRGSPGPAKRFSKFNWAATLIFYSIFYSSDITCFVYLCANRTLLLQQRTGHLGAEPVETHLYPNCFSSSLSFVLTAILNSQAGCRCTLVPRLLFPVPRSPFPVPRSPFPVLVTSEL